MCVTLSGIAEPPGVPDYRATLRTISVMKDGPENLGFSIRGGSEHGLGIFVSEVDETSAAGMYITSTMSVPYQ